MGRRSEAVTAETLCVHDSVFVAQGIHGSGVFARRRFVPNEIIGEVTGAVIRDPDYESDYCMELGENLTLEPEAPFRFLNHSCQPNCELFCWEDEDDPSMARRMWISAIDDVIEPGAELTIDYSWPLESAIACGCGAQECRGWIIDEEELPDLLDLLPPDQVTPDQVELVRSLQA